MTINTVQLCESCKDPIAKTFGSGRFCSRKCSNTRVLSPETKAKIGKSLQGNKNGAWSNPTHADRIRHQRQEAFLDRKVVVSKTKLDITNRQLAEIRRKQNVCMMCKRPETTVTFSKVKVSNLLCIDHDHVTNKFRGLLCNSCNRKLGSYESRKNEIDNYLVNNYSSY